MDNNKFKVLAAGVACGTLLSVSAGATAPNILVVVSDDHSAFATGCYGNPDVKTPNLDKFASEGMLFSRCYAASPQSVPSRASILTGRSPVAVNMSRFSVPLARRFRVFPETLRENGYYTGLAGRGYHLDGPVSGITGRPGKISIVSDYYDEKGLVTFPERMDTCMVIINGIKGSTHGETNAQFRKFMDSRDKDKPFFLQLCYADPHTPYDAPMVHNRQNLELPSYYPDTEKVRDHLGSYYDEISRLDTDFGELMDLLDKYGLRDNTLVIFTGDNGGAQFRAKGTLYDAGIRVPMIMRWPGKVNPGICNEVVSNVDISATCLEAAGLLADKESEGISLFATISGKAPAARYVFSERGNHGTNTLPYSTSCFDQQRCVVGSKYKLIYNIMPNNQWIPVDVEKYPHFVELSEMNSQGKLDSRFSEMYFSPTRPMFELFDLEVDPDESVNLFENPELKGVRDDLIRRLTYKMIDDEDFCPLPHPKLYDR